MMRNLRLDDLSAYPLRVHLGIRRRGEGTGEDDDRATPPPTF